MFSFRVFKPIDWETSAVEVMQEGMVIAEVFAGADGVRHLHVEHEWAARGINWDEFIRAAPRITALLDEADAERADVRSWLDRDR